jgi:soluble lytic murein transglycosylase-like protein
MRSMTPRAARRALQIAMLRRLAWCMAWALLLALLLHALPSAAQAQPGPHPHAQRWRAELTRAAHLNWGLDAPVALFAAQVHQESSWQPGAVSHVGAQGLAQFMPATAAWWCAGQRIGSADCLPTNPAWALRAMVGYNRWLYERLGAAGGPGPRAWAMLRAYNGGLGHWQAEARVAGTTAWPAVDAACGRARRAAVHCGENLHYPRRIMVELQPRYATWGPAVAAPAARAGGRP